MPFYDFAHGVYATQRQYRVAHGGFNQHSQVTSGRHLQHDTAYGYAQYVFGLILHGKALEGIGRRANKLHDEFEFHFPSNRGFRWEEGSVGQGGGSTGRSRVSPYE